MNTLRFWRLLSEALATDCAVLISVVETRGSVPRKRGTRMGLCADGTLIGTMGGGAAESKCLLAARGCLVDGKARTVMIDLRGDSAALREGVCGGTMRVVVVRLSNDESTRTRLATICESLQSGRCCWVVVDAESGESFQVSATKVESPGGGCDCIFPPRRLAIVGAGHVGRAIARMAAGLDFQIAIHDERPEWLDQSAFAADQEILPRVSELIAWLDAADQPPFLLLVTKGMPADLAILSELRGRVSSLRYLGIMGSARRLQVLRDACDAAGLPPWPNGIVFAPIGIEIGAESPDEIAISILAEVVSVTRQPPSFG